MPVQDERAAGAELLPLRPIDTCIRDDRALLIRVRLLAVGDRDPGAEEWNQIDPATS